MLANISSGKSNRYQLYYSVYLVNIVYIIWQCQASTSALLASRLIESAKSH